jgi:PPOX class probable F420-dependent enzyme
MHPESDRLPELWSTGAVTTPAELTNDARAFLAERHLGTLSTIRRDGTLHVCAVGFTWDDAAGVARVITNEGSQKVRNVEATGRAVVAHVDGGRWLSLEGPARVARADADVAEAVARYTERYQEPRPNADRIAIEIRVERVLGRA